MNDYMNRIWCWYLERSPWIKWALFLFVVIAIIVLGIISFFLSGKSVPSLADSTDPEKELKERLEDRYEENLKETAKMDSELARKILSEEEKRREIGIKKKKILEEAKRVHEDIDSATDFGDVDNAIERYIERTITNRNRDS